MEPDLARFHPSRWRALCARIGARFDVDAAFGGLRAAYAEPHRAYHDATHVDDCLGQLDGALELCERPDEVELALWFHDAIYSTRAPDNEAASARLALDVLAESALGGEALSRIEALILATKHDGDAPFADAVLLVDVDLSILGRGDARFDEYEARIRREYRWVPGPLYRRKRREVLAGFLDRPRIYGTGHFHDRYEARARANLARSIERLR